MNQRSKLNSGEKEQEQQSASAQHSQQPAAMEFETPEAMLRHDAQQTVVPAGIPGRLRDSLGGTPSEPKSWWKRLFGGSGS